MLTLTKLGAKADRRLQLLTEGAAGSLFGPNTLAPCYHEACPSSCSACESRSPLSAITWVELRRRARENRDARDLASELQEAEDRAFIRRRDWQTMLATELAAQWEREDHAAADRALVAAVAARREVAA